VACNAGRVQGNTARRTHWGPALTPVTAVVASACVGRGQRFYGGQSYVETAAIQAALPPGTPMVGLFANGALADALPTQTCALITLRSCCVAHRAARTYRCSSL